MKKKPFLRIVFLLFCCNTYTISVAEIETDWYWPRLGTSIGFGMLDAYDFDENGNMEIVVTAGGWGFSGPTALYVLNDEFDEAYCWIPISPDFHDGVIWDVNNDSPSEIIIADGNEIKVLRWDDCEVISSFQIDMDVERLAFGNTVSEQQLDIAFSAAGDLHLSQWDQPDARITSSGMAGSTIRFAPIDTISGDDIIVTRSTIDDSFVRLHSGLSLDIIEERLVRTEGAVGVAQLDGIGNAEILLPRRLSSFTDAFQLGSDEPILTFSYYEREPIRTFDFQNDGIDELLLSYRHSAVIRDNTGNVINDIPHNLLGTGIILPIDLDVDGSMEVIFGAGARSTGEDNLLIGDLTNNSIVHRSEDYASNLLIATIESIDQSDVKPLAVAFKERDAGISQGGWVTLDRTSGEETSINNTPAGLGHTTIESIFSEDVNGDGKLDLCIASADSLGCYNTSPVEEIWTTTFDEQIHLVSSQELFSEGRTTISVGLDSEVRLVDGQNGFLIWVSEEIPRGNSFYPSPVESIVMQTDFILVTKENTLHLLDPSNGNIASTDEINSIKQAVAFDGGLAALAPGIGVVSYDYVDQLIEDVIYSSEEDFNVLASSDNEFFLGWSSDRFFQFANPIDTYIYAEGDVLDLDIGRSNDIQLENNGQVFAATLNGVIAFSLDYLFVDGFEN